MATDWDTLRKDVHLPCIAHWQNRHYVVIYRVTEKHVYLADPATGKLRYTKEEFLAGWQNALEADGYSAAAGVDAFLLRVSHGYCAQEKLLALFASPSFGPTIATWGNSCSVC